MLSILIPTYNYNCYPFVKEIHLQLVKERIIFEIICYDDGSNSKENIENEKINLLQNSKFNSLGKNIGRSAIRNLLAKKAKYEWLLFLDSDGFPVKKTFIRTYIENIQKSGHKFSGFIGGRIHKKTSQRNLRAKFGIEREELSCAIRNKKPFRFFFTSNVLFKKSVFEKVNFNEELKGYGYEDLLFGNEMKEKQHKILHIDNPVYHLQIENNAEFINKTKQGLKNLLFLRTKKIVTSKDIKLLVFFDKINAFKLNRIFIKKQHFFMKKAIKTSSLFYYDLFKLSYLCYLNDKNR